LGDSGLPFLLFVLLVAVLPPEEVQTTFTLRFKNVCTSSGGMVIHTKTVHFYLECLAQPPGMPTFCRTFAEECFICCNFARPNFLVTLKKQFGTI